MGHAGRLVHHRFQGLLLFGVNAQVSGHLGHHRFFFVGVGPVGPGEADKIGDERKAQVTIFQYVQILLNALVIRILGSSQHLLRTVRRQSRLLDQGLQKLGFVVRSLAVGGG